MEKLEVHQVPEYLAQQLPQHRLELERIIALVQEEIPGSEPCISYQIIGFAVGKKRVFYVSGWNDHLSFHGTHKHTNADMAQKYPQWFTLKGMTLQFQANPPLPEAIVRELTRERYATFLGENQGK